MADSPLLLLVGVSLSLLVACVALALELQWRRRWRALLDGSDVGGAPELLRLQAERLDRLRRDLASLAERLGRLDQRLAGCLRAPGVVRFNAYADTGADLSFALALTDAAGNGVVVSSLFGRDDGRIFAKPLVSGASQHKLTPEEQEAIRRAWTPSSS